MINADHSVLYEHYPLHLLLGNKKAATEYSVTAFFIWWYGAPGRITAHFPVCDPAGSLSLMKNRSSTIAPALFYLRASSAIAPALLYYLHPCRHALHRAGHTLCVQIHSRWICRTGWRTNQSKTANNKKAPSSSDLTLCGYLIVNVPAREY